MNTTFLFVQLRCLYVDSTVPVCLTDELLNRANLHMEICTYALNLSHFPFVLCILLELTLRFVEILKCVCFCVCLSYGISPENIILYGQSIGTVPTVDLASRFECAAVILHSPLTSGMRVAFPDTKKTYCFDAFPK